LKIFCAIFFSCKVVLAVEKAQLLFVDKLMVVQGPMVEKVNLIVVMKKIQASALIDFFIQKIPLI